MIAGGEASINAVRDELDQIETDINDNAKDAMISHVNPSQIQLQIKLSIPNACLLHSESTISTTYN